LHGEFASIRREYIRTVGQLVHYVQLRVSYVRMIIPETELLA